MLKVALAQMNSSSDWKANLAYVLAMIQKASRRKAKLVLFPENALFVGNPDEVHDVAKELSSTAPKAIAQAAKKNHIAVLLGSYPEVRKGSRRVFNTSLFFSESGGLVGRYRKIHLFDVETPRGIVYSESKTIFPGNKIVTVRWKGIRFGLSICFDLRFPEHYRELRKRKSEVFLIPSAFTDETGREHWHSLLRARAIENLAYVLAPAQTGQHALGRKTYGHSLAVSPWGEILADADRRPGLCFAHIDLRAVHRLRWQFQRRL